MASIILFIIQNVQNVIKRKDETEWSKMNTELENKGCTCENGYYCRFCRILDKEQEQREFDNK